MTTILINTADVGVEAAAMRGAAAVRDGKLVAFATETVYGIAVCADDDAALERLRTLKDRPTRPFSVHLGRAADAYRYVSRADTPPQARRLIEKAWPGPITIVLKANGHLADPALKPLYGRLCHDDCIGLRCPDEPLASAMLSAVERTVVAPSANLAGEPSPHTAKQVMAALEGKVDLVIDSGPTRHRKDSTIVRADDDGIHVLRAGAIDEKSVHRLAAMTIVFVCTGNTCRSPMAEGIAKKLLAEKLSCQEDDLNHRGYEVVSAGLFASDGARATPEAVLAAKRLGADIEKHRSQRLTGELIRRADVIFCMTRFHAQQIRELGADAQVVQLLDPKKEIADPLGGADPEYAASAGQIAAALREALDTRLP
ncbi:MAG: threonylcarbamoyl-AMP synthase [Planctomycetes bacterium]|nr:threonylcarbamoyl-AMP synthase [Planctomycetota bacterium]